ALYHATKFAVEGLTESLQYELNPFGIRLKIVEPGGYQTNFSGRSMSYFGADGLDGYEQPWDQFMAKIAAWPYSGNISEVAEVIYTAATDGSEKLRYPAGQDAFHLLEVRHQMDDETFKKMMVERIGI
ncbi:SDR family NAD(P)-dependent oxidoreductase, partial [Puia sp.]|uniref:SDR family NAD(P)-dependent oxidoreductase n=1 Tax=Puia sp. TaxID=2045100 RepID=UPI002F42ED16